MLNQLTKLATEKSSAKRLELMNAITDMFIDKGQNSGKNELDLFGDVFIKLLDDIDIKSKIEISNKFARVDNTPPSFASALAFEQAEVAAPMLEYSNVFIDDELLDVTAHATIYHRIAIAKRRTISSVVCDALIDHGETPVLRTVTSNLGARISANGFKRIVAYSAEDGELIANLAGRNDLPKDIKILLPHLKGGIQKQIYRAIEKHGKEEMQDLVDRSHQHVHTTKTQENVNKKSTLSDVNLIRSGHLKLDDVVIKLAIANKPSELAQVISEVEHIDKAQISSAILQSVAKPITLLCRSIELSDPAFRQICIMRESCLSQTKEASDDMMRCFTGLDVDYAKRTIRYIKLQLGASEKQQEDTPSKQ
ncbi:MAG: DUF2336 domain-containing protein [Rhizobiales bacterium]|nr:DUF2336 domain-containing protein [Hyphomicrobiales bacterium]